MIRAVITDDEPMAREALLALIEKYCPEVGIICFHEGKEDHVKAIGEFQY